MDRIVLPMSSLAGWAMIVMGVISSLIVVGVNVQPLLAFGGVSGIAIGLGAQQVTSNLVAGINLVSASAAALRELATLAPPPQCRSHQYWLVKVERTLTVREVAVIEKKIVQKMYDFCWSFTRKGLML